MKRRALLFSLLALVLTICALKAQELVRESSQEEGLPLGTTWYYNMDERQYVDSPPRYGYIRHRIERNLEMNGYQVQEISALRVYYTGEESPLESLYLHQEGGKRYLLEDGKLRLLYDIDAEEGDIVPLPAHPEAYQLENFIEQKVTVIKKEKILFSGVELIRQTYELDFIFEQGSWPIHKKRIDVIEGLGTTTLNSLYSPPVPYGIQPCYWIDRQPILRCYDSGDIS